MLSGQLLPVLLLVAGPVAQAANLCFLPGGKQVGDVPCDMKAQVSMCCGSVAACLSNGLCKDEKTTNDTGVAYARGTCTDPTWQSPICPQHCQLNQDTPRNRSAYDFRLNGVQMWQCDAQGFGNPANYCCESTAEKTRCCSTSSALFKLAAATPGNALAIQTFLPSAAPATSSTDQAAPLPTSVPPSGATSTGQAQSASETAASDGTTVSQENALDRNSMIAVGTGAGFGAAAIASIVVMLLVRRTRRKDQAASECSNMSHHSEFFQREHRNGSLAGSESKWNGLTRFDTMEADNASASRYWVAADGSEVMDPYKTPSSTMSHMSESPVLGKPSPTATPGGGFGLGLNSNKLAPQRQPSSRFPANFTFGKKRSIYEMP